ncbi:MAG TPA: cytochrome c biogenesis protein CcsA [Acidobacteriota bacterium]|nr:cytochrome c biogenesis protein CcsA [Acidobacteriota bacterium]
MWLESSSYFQQRADRYLKWAAWLLVPLYLVGVAALYAAFIHAPTERTMGEVQRIFYFHVGAAWTAFLAFFVVFVAGIAYLWRRNLFWDELGAASAEVGVVFTTIVLTTGPIWARPIWNTWWPWGDPRVTTTLVLWLIYVAYFALRSSLPAGEKRARLAAVFGIIGFIDVPIVFLSVRWWRTIHPVVITRSEVRLEPEMVQALLIAVAAFTILYFTLLLTRTAMRLQDAASEEIMQAVRERSD